MMDEIQNTEETKEYLVNLKKMVEAVELQLYMREQMDLMKDGSLKKDAEKALELLEKTMRIVTLQAEINIYHQKVQCQVNE